MGGRGLRQAPPGGAKAVTFATASVLLFALALLTGAVLGFRKSRRDARAGDERIQAAFEHSVRRSDAGLPTIPLDEIYKERQ